jgi:hypothetical protein
MVGLSERKMAGELWLGRVKYRLGRDGDALAFESQVQFKGIGFLVFVPGMCLQI